MTDKELIKQEIEKRIKNLEFSLERNCVEKHSKLDILGNITTLESLLQFIDSLPEEPASEGLIEEIDKIWKTCNPIDEGMGVETANIHIEQFDDIARHFAEWQKNQMKETLQTEYEKGKFDAREEMMKDAVEGEVVYKIGNAEIAPTDVRYKVMSDRVYIPNVKLGDKVKIIIVKTEQQ